MAPVPGDLVERLYTVPPERFVAARAEAIAAARAAGDRAAARDIGKLRKPTVAAWLVNLLAIRRPDLVGELVELSGALRSAQRELRGPRLRELSAQRRALVGALVGEARALALAAEPELVAAKLPLAEVEATFNAALADADVAEQVRSGRLVRAATYAGFGEVPRPRLRLLAGGGAERAPAGRPPGAPGAPAKGEKAAARAAKKPARAEGEKAARAGGEKAATRAAGKAAGAERKKTTAGAEVRKAAAAAERSRKADEAARAARRRALAKELTNARTQHKRAEADLERATAHECDGAAALARIEAELADLQRRRAEAAQEVDRRKLARKAAERAAVGARRRAGEVEAALEAFDAEPAGERTPSG